jgi:monoterpene epsilon-lactone hydrolase
MTRRQRQAIDEMLRSNSGDFGAGTIDDMRTSFQALMAPMQVPTDVRRTPTELGGIPALLVEPLGETRRGTILYFHGGSFVVGSPETAIGLTANLVSRTGIRSISVDYRLAPEHPFPAGIEDGVAAYRALLDSGIDPASIAFAGDSAGGGLSITVCHAARDAGLPVPAAIVTFSAGLDAGRSGASVDTRADADPMLSREALRPTTAMYLNGQDANQALLSPAVFADLTGFPPLLLQVGTNEILLDDSTRLAERARDADVDVILDVTANVPHVFQSFVGLLDESDQALDRAALFLRQHVR